MNDQGSALVPVTLGIILKKAVTASLRVWKNLSDDTLTKPSLHSCSFLHGISVCWKQV